MMPNPHRTRLMVTHNTTYHYGARVQLARHLAYLQPINHAYQQLENFSLHISPQPSYRVTEYDHYQNARERFGLYVAHYFLRVQATSYVGLTPASSGLDGTQSPAWEEVREKLRYRAHSKFFPASDFVFASPFITLPLAFAQELADYACSAFTPQRPLLDAALAWMRCIHRDFSYVSASTEISTPLRETLRNRQGVCQDFAHIMIAGMRALGLPARYVSGYLLTQPLPGQQRLVGADASHAWVSVWCPKFGWIDLDPTNDLIPNNGDTHVTVAIGRDYGDVTPLRGIIRGGGEHTLSVGVTVTPLGSDDLIPILNQKYCDGEL